MPVFTDSLLLGEVMRRVKLAPVAAKCLFAPLQWFGNSHHHLDFPGTLSASPRGYLDMLKDLARCFIDHGFTRIVFVNGHGGNIVPSQQALFELKQDLRNRRELLLALADLLGIGRRPIEDHSRTRAEADGPRLRVGDFDGPEARPQLVVGEVAQVPEVPFGKSFAPGYRAWVMPDRSEPGHIGHPSIRDRGEGRGALRLLRGWRCALPGTRGGMGWPIVGMTHFR